MVASGAKTRSAGSAKLAGKSHHPTHPPWIEMITECIATTPDGTRHGVSRPAIKKFVDSKYHLAMNGAATSQLNRAITHGTHSGDFVLPKGPSGKVKLAPRRAGEIAKENKKPSAALKSRGQKEGPLFAEEHRLTVSPATRKYKSKAKKARLYVTPIPGRRIPPQNATTTRSGAKTGAAGSSSRTRGATKRMAESKRRARK